MNKKIMYAASIVMGAAFLFNVMGSTFSYERAYASSNVISVYLDGKKLSFDVNPELKSNRTFVPMSAIFKALGAQVVWNEQTQSVFAMGKGKAVSLRIGSQYASTDGKTITLDAAPYVKNNRTLVPIKFVSESLGATVKWDEKTQSVFITSPTTDTASKPTYSDGNKPVDAIQVSPSVFGGK